jgi:hypothetical protein
MSSFGRAASSFEHGMGRVEKMLGDQFHKIEARMERMEGKMEDKIDSKM